MSAPSTRLFIRVSNPTRLSLFAPLPHFTNSIIFPRSELLSLASPSQWWNGRALKSFESVSMYWRVSPHLRSESSCTSSSDIRNVSDQLSRFSWYLCTTFYLMEWRVLTGRVKLSVLVHVGDLVISAAIAYMFFRKVPYLLGRYAYLASVTML